MGCVNYLPPDPPFLWANKDKPFPEEEQEDTSLWSGEPTDTLCWPSAGKDYMDAYHEYADEI